MRRRRGRRRRPKRSWVGMQMGYSRGNGWFLGHYVWGISLGLVFLAFYGSLGLFRTGWMDAGLMRDMRCSKTKEQRIQRASIFISLQFTAFVSH